MEIFAAVPAGRPTTGGNLLLLTTLGALTPNGTIPVRHGSPSVVLYQSS